MRVQKRIAFLAIQDGSSLEPLQAVLTPEKCEGLTHGTAISATGSWVQSKGKGQSYELEVTSISMLAGNDAEHNPIQPKYQSSEFLRTIPHLRARVATNALLLRLRSSVIALVTNWFHDRGFIQCHTPIITSSDCEGAGEVFTVQSGEEAAASNDASQPFFRKEKYLTVSAQLHLEALAQAVHKVWTLSPTFRAEKSDTPRHLSEFYMLEAELCFTESMDEVMNVVESMLRHVATKLRGSELFSELRIARQRLAGNEDSGTTEEKLQARWAGLADSSWPRISYNKAIEIIMAAHASGEASFSIAPSHDGGLAAEHERYVANVVGEGKPVFVTDYPMAQKPFYMASGETDTKTARCFDLLVPDLGELVGGSMREHDMQRLQESMQSKGVRGEGLEWYLDLRRYGSVPHGGFGLGFDRLLCYLAGVSSIRDVVSFPRYFGKCDC